MMFRRIFTSFMPISRQLRKAMRSGSFSTAEYLNAKPDIDGSGTIRWTTRDLLFGDYKAKDLA